MLFVSHLEHYVIPRSERYVGDTRLISSQENIPGSTIQTYIQALQTDKCNEALASLTIKSLYRDKSPNNPGLVQLWLCTPVEYPSVHTHVSSTKKNNFNLARFAYNTICCCPSSQTPRPNRYQHQNKITNQTWRPMVMPGLPIKFWSASFKML